MGIPRIRATTFIYGLCDPETEECRYVGKADKPKHRYAEHLKLDQNCHKTAWLKFLLNRGYMPEMFILEEVPIGEWEEAERFWIGYLRSIGCRLTNHSPGGNGGDMLTEISRKKLSKSLKGRKLSPEHAEKARKARLGIPHSKEIREKISMALIGKNTGNFHSSELKKEWSRKKKAYNKEHPEVVENQRKKALEYHQLHPEAGKVQGQKIKEFYKQNPEARERLSIVNRGRKATKEHREKTRKSMLLRCRDPRERAKLRQQAKDYWAKKKGLPTSSPA